MMANHQSSFNIRDKNSACFEREGVSAAQIARPPHLIQRTEAIIANFSMSASGWKILATGTLSCLFQLRSKKKFCTTVTTLLICKFVSGVRICRVCERPRFVQQELSV
jgi:hypothetical protein